METLLSSVEKVVVIPRDVRQRNLIFAARRERERQACLRGGKACEMQAKSVYMETRLRHGSGQTTLLLKHKLQPYIPPTSSTQLLSNPLQPCTPYPTLLSPHHQSSSHPIPSHPKHPIRPSRRPADPQSLPPPPQSASRGVYSPPIAPSLNTRKGCFSYYHLDSTARNVRA
ncbi:hypothetical protein HBI24_153050 [Parastagonospora nodorum]|nr:hypothetical protein HBI95_140760 [Parastagonospora nodorum]KAH5320196.1 hypothetical protein HBI50_112520 [Parastagonospora nodorum]KAH5579289.1 hypothetical protein HBI24_153050 [Parastagonospora nodorum]